MNLLKSKLGSILSVGPDCRRFDKWCLPASPVTSCQPEICQGLNLFHPPEEQEHFCKSRQNEIKQTLAIFGGVKIELYFRRANPPKWKNQTGHKNSQHKKDSNLGNLILELEFLFADCYSESLTRFLFFSSSIYVWDVYLQSSVCPIQESTDDVVWFECLQNLWLSFWWHFINVCLGSLTILLCVQCRHH